MKPAATSPARYLNLLLQLLEQRDIDCAPALDALGVERARLAHPLAKVPTGPAIKAFQQLVDEHGGAALGLQLGRLITAGQLGELGHTVLSCATLGEALRCVEEVYDVISPSFRLRVTHQPHVCELAWFPAQALPYDFVLFCFDMALAAVDGLLVHLLGEAAPLCDAYLTRARPAHALAYGGLRRMRCHFARPGVPSLRICLPAGVLAHPMPLGNAGELAMRRDRLRQAVRPLPQDDLSAWVEMMLKETAGEQPSQVFLAQIAGMSASTFARRLAAQGATFRGIANRVRHDMACRLLGDGGLSVAEVSARLGYADTPSFVRAFKAIAGTTPGRYAAPG